MVQIPEMCGIIGKSNKMQRGNDVDDDNEIEIYT